MGGGFILQNKIFLFLFYSYSKAKGGLTPEDPFKPSDNVGKAEGPAQYFHNWDQNGDGIIDIEEAGLFARNFNYLYFNETDVLEMIEKVTT